EASSVAPLAIVVPAAVAPRALLFAICSAPALIVVAPWYELFPGRIIRPGPILMIPPGPDTDVVGSPTVSTSGEGNRMNDPKVVSASRTTLPAQVSVAEPIAAECEIWSVCKAPPPANGPEV